MSTAIRPPSYPCSRRNPLSGPEGNRSAISPRAPEHGDPGIAIVATLTRRARGPRRRLIEDGPSAQLLASWAEPSSAHGPASLLKRAIDVTGALVGLLMLSPMMLAIALLIRLDSPGPALFRQWRRGRRGRAFPMLKFRTMVVDAEEWLGGLECRNESAGGVLFKLRDDPRVTRLGWLLRRTSLDELPQLFNVLRGQMSLVGPRPLQLRDSDRLAAADPRGYRRRLQVRPGLTGPWQVEGRGEQDYRRMVELDCEYVGDVSIGRDLGIIARTALVVLLGRGAF